MKINEKSVVFFLGARTIGFVGEVRRTARDTVGTGAKLQQSRINKKIP